MCKRKNEIDVKLLLFAIQKSVAFENLMAKTFNGSTIVQNYNKSLDNITVSTYIYLINKIIIELSIYQKQPEVNNAEIEEILQPFSEELKISDDILRNIPSQIQKNELKQNLSPFNGLISDCFQPFLYIYIDSVDK